VDKLEAAEILESELARFAGKSYDELVEFIKNVHVYEKSGKSGVTYQLELQAFWDNPSLPNGNLRVILSIDDGRFPSAFLPLTSDFVLMPDGNQLE
jgi:hypothetical protein